MGKHEMTVGEAKAKRRRERAAKRLAQQKRRRGAVRGAVALALALLAGAAPAVAVAAPAAQAAPVVREASAAHAATVPGIDVSHWQGPILWVNVAGSGVQAPIIKQSGSDVGYFYVDSKYASNVANARAHYSRLGHYYFNGALNGTSAADRFSANLTNYRAGDWLVYDAEGAYTSTTDAYQWLTRMRQLRPDAHLVVYMSSSVTTSRNWSAVQALGYVDLWVASYGASPRTGPWPVWAGWQYTDNGRVSGISGTVDRSYVATEAWGGTVIGGSGQASGSGWYGSVPYGSYLGYDVRTTQRLLNAQGASLAVDGWYGSLTRAAVSAFQASHGLTVDGYAGPATQALLRGQRQVLAVDGYAGRGTITRAQQLAGTPVDGIVSGQSLYARTHLPLLTAKTAGLSGSTFVRAFQVALGLRADGQWGPQTTMRLQYWLNRHGYGRLRVDGVFGLATAAAWQRALNAGFLF